ncbi:putative PGG domain-containing protein [Dioscorea sansibarensis]
MSDQSRVIVEMLSQKLPPSGGEQSQREKQQKDVVGWEANKNSTLLVVATLITTLTYQIGCNPPGGFWQDSGKDKNGKGHEAGAPIMRDMHPERYWLFMTAAWVGFGDSMLLTLWLLSNAPVSSRRVRWSFIVAYSSLQLTYITAMFGSSLIIDLATWAGVMIVLSFVVGLEKEGQKHMLNYSPCCGKLWLWSA